MSFVHGGGRRSRRSYTQDDLEGGGLDLDEIAKLRAYHYHESANSSPYERSRHSSISSPYERSRDRRHGSLYASTREASSRTSSHFKQTPRRSKSMDDASGRFSEDGSDFLMSVIASRARDAGMGLPVGQEGSYGDTTRTRDYYQGDVSKEGCYYPQQNASSRGYQSKEGYYPQQNTKEDSAQFDSQDLVMSVVRSRASSLDDSSGLYDKPSSPSPQEHDSIRRYGKPQPQSSSSPQPQRPAVESLPGAFAAHLGGSYEQRTKATLATSSAENSPQSSTRSISDLEEGNNPSGDALKASERSSASGMSPKWKRYFIILLVTAVLILLLGIGIGISIPFLLDHMSDPSEDMAMMQIEEVASEAPTWLVPNMTYSTLLALEDPFSIQSAAYDWISRDPHWDTFEDWQKQERFAIASIYNAFGDYSAALPSYYTNICQWMPGMECNEQGQVITLWPRLLSKVKQQYMPPEVSYLSHLQNLHIHMATLSGPKSKIEQILPLDALRVFPPITNLQLTNCHLAGSIPSTLGLLTGLTSLDASGNRLMSSIPSQLGLLSNLTSLVLSSNDLTGTIPEEIGDLSLLETFMVNDNPSVETELPSGLCTPPVDDLQTDWCVDAGCC